MTTDNITTYLGWIIAVGTLLFSWYKLRLETPGARADLADKYHKMALASADNEKNMKTRVDELETRLDSMEAKHAAEMADVKAQLRDAEEHNTAMEEWASEVLAVLQSLKITMTRPKPERKK